TKDPKKKRRSVARIDPETLTRMVKHILSFSQALSWGTKELRQNGKTETITFPRLTRTHPVEVMFMDYARKEAELKGIEFNEERQPPQHTTYYLLVKHLTPKAEKSITCIDYVQDILVNVQVTGLTTIIEQVVAPTQQKAMQRYVLVLQNFLKYQYDGHLEEGSVICSHSINYGLRLEQQSYEGNNSSNCVQIQGIKHCPACKFVEYFMRVILPGEVKENQSSANSASVEDALDYIEDSLDCFHRYQAHCVRVKSQQKAIQQVDLKLKEEVLRRKQRGTTVKITMDFKQKLLEKRLRSSQMNDFGQRGNSWHIGVIEYYDFEAPCQANGNTAQAVPMMFPLDQILDTGNKQDGLCVLSMLEAMMKIVTVQFHFVERIILASDNANCYHSKELIFPICFLNQLSSSPKIIKYIHPDSQDGKGLCDSHAAVAGTHVDRHYIRTQKDDTLTKNEACTPTELANALCTNGRINQLSRGGEIGMELVRLGFGTEMFDFRLSLVCAMDVGVFIPTSSGSFRATRCVCGDRVCRESQQRFKKMNDARGGFFTVPAEVGSRKEAGGSGRGRGASFAAEKRKMIDMHVSGKPIPNGRCFVAMLHFSPIILKSKCMRRRGKDYTYCWLLRQRVSGELEDVVAPNYPLVDVLRDVRETEKAHSERPVYTAASKRSTEEIVRLFVGDRTKMTQAEKKRMRDFSHFMRRQIKNGRRLPLEKEARLEQIGFFRKFPVDIVEAAGLHMNEGKGLLEEPRKQHATERI
ncbi:unnamed protein product, partial [Cylindrotheca closterium]